MTTDLNPADIRARLDRIAGNAAYGWRHAMRMPFVLLDEPQFAASAHSPRAMLAAIDDARIAHVAQGGEFRRRLEAAEEAMEIETSEDGGWWQAPDGVDEDMLVAYFSSEFGVDESLPIYSGGLGVLAGDHLKSASELGLPLVGVGLMYRYGYFRQSIDEFGCQQERYPENFPAQMPLALQYGADGQPLEVRVDLAGDEVRVRVWRADVGRTRLYLLDSDVDGNSDWGRRVTDSLYGGDREQRIRQEILLGIGGVRALRALGLSPTVWHMNEGHAAFLQLERIRELVDAGVTYDEAVTTLRASTVFTTHTPVPAGNEVFDPELVEKYLGGFAERLGPGFEPLRELASSASWGFGMTPFSLRTSAYANGVSALHGEVSREMWAGLESSDSAPVAPIGSITNGVHPRTWLSHELIKLLRQYGVKPSGLPEDQHWERVWDIPDAELWAVHQHRQRHLLDLARMRYERQPGVDGSTWKLEPGVLTIGFARRFATYKRAGLLFSDPDRLARLLGHAERPVQVLLAGKSHPADQGGKDLISTIVGYSRDERSMGRVAFLEDYEMVLARRLVQGVDVWLNTPRLPMEASGTSGMKCAMNGGLNCSILDGWWAEGYSPEVGFKVGGEWSDNNDALQDQRDAADLFRVLEEEVVPAYYERDEKGLPTRWIQMMKASIAQLAPRFDSGRMVSEYAERYYVPAHHGAKPLARS
jgi:starch phosphorylase